MSNPYQDLKKDAADFATNVMSRKRKSGGYYPKKDLATAGLDMKDLYSRVQAAKQLGYETHVEATDQGVEIVYVQNLPNRPWRF